MKKPLVAGFPAQNPRYNPHSLGLFSTVHNRQEDDAESRENDLFLGNFLATSAAGIGEPVYVLFMDSVLPECVQSP
jgi:hypothetical protein